MMVRLKNVRFTLRTLLLATTIAPPTLAAAFLTFPYWLGLAAYLTALALIFPTATYLWRNSASRKQ
jgi:hypothetical protein